MNELDWPAYNVEKRPLSELIPYARNARTHSDAQVNQVAASIREWGWTMPILVREDGTLIAGHCRVMAAAKLGLQEGPVMVAKGWTETQCRAYVLADNQLSLAASWDPDLLSLELRELDELDFDLGLLGFEDGELAGLLDDPEPIAGETDPEAAEDLPEVPAVPVSRPEDVWCLGRHRLICGDATDPTVVDALMQGERAALCVTSPPYGNQRDYTQGGIADWDALMRGVFAQLPLTPEGQVLVNLGLIHRDNEVVPYWDAWIAWMRSQGWRRFAWYVWDQGPGMPGDWAGRLAPSFEFLFHFNRASRKPNKTVPCKWAGQETHLRADGSSTAMRGKDGEVGGWTAAGQPTQEFRIPDSVIRVMRHKGKIGPDIDHPAVFPVALPEFVMEAYTDAGDIVFEPFGGSGTTLLAAERTGRVGRAIEIAPEYVDVAIKRFQQHHPNVAVTLATSGQSFEAVAKDRLAATEARP